ncbi:hypothetical protein J7E88_30655 [Streptomyces sp. ISL-10]|uniref:hypothetical protein n=1 Tax=Streptomyces sp. ISL-10 TaxID=2819172 RepID=UPI001BE89F9B|nr:hypothetical protein [Streptomyces sp. ISL-10]MBT2369520.1 hypothetical protein [Streptomyces sp. ISL-10]
MKRRHWWTVLGQWIAWWALVTAAFWLLGKVLDQPTSLIGCAASAVLVIAVGEFGDRLRRRWATIRTVKQRGHY